MGVIFALFLVRAIAAVGGPVANDLCFDALLVIATPELVVKTREVRDSRLVKTRDPLALD